MGQGIGATVRSLRLRRGLTLEVVAGLVGRDKSWLSRVERGVRPLERRSDIAALAHALQVSPTDITGQPYDISGQPEHEAAMAVPAIRRALQGLPDPADRADVNQLAAQGDALTLMRRRHDLPGLGRAMPGLLTGLRATLPTVASAEDRQRLLRLLFWAAHAAQSLTRDVGFLDLAWIAAEQVRRAAADLADAPVWLAAAEFSRSHALFPYAEKAAVEYGSAGAEAASLLGGPDARAAHGACLLASAYAAALTGASEEAEERLRTAGLVATRQLGREFSVGFGFSADNVELHRMAVAVETGQPERVVAVAAQFTPDAVPSAERRASYWCDLGRAHAQLGHDNAAMAAFRQAEEIAPMRVRLHPLVRETVASMLGRAQRAAAGRGLRGLAYRMGVPH